MRRTCSHHFRERGLNEFETIDFRETDGDVRKFLEYSNEGYVLTDKIVRIVETRPSFSILDVGRGEGYVIRKICSQVKQCTALDPNQKMLEILRSHVDKRCKVAFINNKFEDFETTEKFDIVLSSHTLSFFKDKQQAIKKMLFYTKKDGRLVLVLHCRASEQLQMLKDVFFAIKGKEINHIDAETLCTFLADRGFDPKLDKVGTITKFPSVEIPLKLSYFLFRIGYNKLSEKSKLLIRSYLEGKRQNHFIEIRTLHGIITFRKN